MFGTGILRSEDIKQRVSEQLAWDSRLDASDVQVEVTDGLVRLTGTVPTCADRRNALLDVHYIPGVRKVENRLRVKRPGSCIQRGDEEIRSNILEAFELSTSVGDSNLEVTADKGAATLRGTVDKYWRKVRAEEIAADSDGVLDVINEIAVVPTGDYRDEQIARSIEVAMERQLGEEAGGVDVEVVRGAVTLSGAVPDWTAFRLVQDIALITRGVTDVRNGLVIRG